MDRGKAESARSPCESGLSGFRADSGSHDQILPALDKNSQISIFFDFISICFAFLYLLQFLSENYGKITTILRIFRNLLTPFSARIPPRVRPESIVDYADPTWVRHRIGG